MKNAFVKSLRLEYLPGCGVYRLESVIAERITWKEGSSFFILDGIGAKLAEDELHFVKRFSRDVETVRCVTVLEEPMLRPITSFTAAAYGLVPVGRTWHKRMHGEEIKFSVTPLVVPYLSRSWKRMVLVSFHTLRPQDLAKTFDVGGRAQR